ncbi:MAG: hypothetical protein H6868_07365 [Rhodospirillales bacterium]|nr:hypothetical protein [Rhodospirillales bacterium]
MAGRKTRCNASSAPTSLNDFLRANKITEQQARDIATGARNIPGKKPDEVRSIKVGIGRYGFGHQLTRK